MSVVVRCPSVLHDVDIPHAAGNIADVARPGLEVRDLILREGMRLKEVHPLPFGAGNLPEVVLFVLDAAHADRAAAGKPDIAVILADFASGRPSGHGADHLLDRLARIRLRREDHGMGVRHFQRADHRVHAHRADSVRVVLALISDFRFHALVEVHLTAVRSSGDVHGFHLNNQSCCSASTAHCSIPSQTGKDSGPCSCEP